MIFFAVYAFVVWYFALRWRRRWQGFAAVALGVILLLALISLLSANETVFGLRGQGVMLLLYAETALVLSFGLFAACLPYRHHPAHCKHCRYDLSGLVDSPDNPPATITCPECGKTFPTPPALLIQHPSPPQPLTPIPSSTGIRRKGI